MKHYITRIAIASFLMLAMGLFATDSHAALNAYLMLKGRNNGKTYKSSLDASGKFSFSNVEPGQYDLIVGCDGKGECPSSIEISSFSWGATNSGSMSSSSSGASGKSTQVTRSNISNNRTASPAVTTSGGVRVATGDLDGDGAMDMITSPVTVTLDASSSSLSYTKIVFSDIMVSSVCSPNGGMKASYDLKMNKK